MFIATTNSLNIPAPLLDRMEVIRIPGYTEDEKVNIAQRYLLSKQMEANGLKAGEMELKELAITIFATTPVKRGCVGWARL